MRTLSLGEWKKKHDIKVDMNKSLDKARLRIYEDIDSAQKESTSLAPIVRGVFHTYVDVDT